MNSRRLLSSSVILGLGDVAVVAVGGFLLLPLYARTLSQEEFGNYVAVRTNIDIFTYVLQMGIPSAMARLYLEYRKTGAERSYVISTIWLFMAILLLVFVVCSLWGGSIWYQLSPQVSAWPALPFAFAIAMISFPAALSIVWLRSEGKVFSVLGLQLGSSAVLAAVAAVALLVWEMQLEGILLALLVGALVPAAVLPIMLGFQSSWWPRREHMLYTLKFALPVMVGYFAYFVLNRFSTLLLQRHVAVEELAVFGMAQQLSMIVAMACTSFGAALQPMVFSCEVGRVNEALVKSGKLLAILMSAVLVALLLFAHELQELVAPGYNAGLGVLTILAVGNFTLAATLISETALLYHKKIKTSVSIGVISALSAAGIGLWLVPQYQIVGGALAVAFGFSVRMVLSQWAAYKLTGISRWFFVFGGTASAVVFGWAALQIQGLPLSALALFGTKATMLLIISGVLLLFYRKSNF